MLSSKILIAVIVLLVLLGGGFFLYQNNQKMMATPSSQVNSPAPTSSTTGLANPASVNCNKLGGTLTIKKRGDGGEYGLCTFEDNMACEEWALMRGECPKGGIKTTGFDTEAQKYCAWLGGKTLAVANATCTLPSGQTCSDEDLYNGKCSPSASSSSSSMNPSLQLVKQNALSTISWSGETSATENIAGTNVVGKEIIGSLTSSQGALSDIGEKSALTKQGWKEDIDLEAGGANGGAWGYTKGNELLFFTFENKSFVSPPAETTCPCSLNVKVFYSANYKP